MSTETNLLEPEKKILTRLSLVVKRLDKEKQNYILGYAEGMAANKKEKSEEVEESDTNL